MFKGCTHLSSIPYNLLPATSLGDYCYQYMFAGCTSLRSIPQNLLPITTLFDGCYWGMFAGCTSLSSVPQNLLPASTLINQCYQSMFAGCNNITNTPYLPALNLSSRCYYRMFSNCNNIINGLYLPATNLSGKCYWEMFRNCSKLTSITADFTDWNSNNYATSCWLSGVSPTGIFYKKSELPIIYGPSYIPSGWTVQIDDAFKIVAVQENCTITLKNYGTVPSTLLQYNKNNTGWTNYSANTLINLTNIGQYVQFRNLSGTFSNSTSKYYYFTMTNKVKLQNSLYSLINGNKKVNNYCFYKLFTGCSSIVEVSQNLLPMNNLGTYCYSNMFYGCTNLTNMPVLSTNNLSAYCYQSMFYGCTNLSDVKILPAIKLNNYCYQNMFYNCTSLIEAPYLPATVLSTGCYNSMFRGCSKLSSISACLKSWSTSYSQYWVTSVSAMGHFYKTSDLAFTYGTSYIPSNWQVTDMNTSSEFKLVAVKASTKVMLKQEGTVSGVSLQYNLNNNSWQDYTPNTIISLASLNNYVQFRNLSSTFSKDYNNYFCVAVTGQIRTENSVNSLINNSQLTPYCFNRLFYNCSSLIEIPQNLLPATTLAAWCYSYMFQNCTNLSSIPQNLLPASTLAYGCYSCMFSNCTSLSNIQQNLLHATTLADYCYSCMFQNCTNLSSIPQNLLPATTLAAGCYHGMFYNCISLSSVPWNLLPATTLSRVFLLHNGCYSNMFYNCSSLINGPYLPAINLSSCCYTNMFTNCKKITSITADFTDWQYSNIYGLATNNWLSGVSRTGTFYKKSALSTIYGPSYIPSGWTVINK